MDKLALLLLHGALGAQDQFAPLVPLLADRFDLHRLDFEGHGAAPLRDRPFRMEHFATNVLDYLTAHDLAQADLLGYSMGGYVACTLARARPDLVRRVATLGTKFYWDPETASREVARLDPEKIRAKVPHFARALEARHPASGWETVLRHTRDLLLGLGETGGLRPADVADLALPVRICVGDRDSTVSLAETAEIYRALPQGQLEVLPGTPHEFERVAPARLAATLIDFFAS